MVGETVTDLAQYGLAQPRTTVTAVARAPRAPDAAARRQDARRGERLRQDARVRRASSPSPPTPTGAFDKKPFDLRDRDVLHVKRDEVRTLEVTGPEGAYALASDGAEWAFARPLATRAGRWSVDGLLGALEGLRMESMAAEDAKDLKKFGLDTPARTVTLGLPTARRARSRSAAGDGRQEASTRARRPPARWWSSRARWWTTWPRAWPSCAPSAC